MCGDKATLGGNRSVKNLAFALAALMALAIPAYAQSTPGLATVVATCGTPPDAYSANTNRPVTQNTSGQTCSASSSTPSGTQNVNVSQVGGNAVTTSLPVAGTGTAGTPATGVVSVQGITGGTAINNSEAPTNAAGNAITPCVSQGASTLQCGSAAAKNLYVVYLTATADSWLMVFNTTTTPANGATTAGTASGNLEDCVKVASGTTTSIGGLPIPKRYSAGVYIAISSTACSTLTLATTGLLNGLVQ